jgi:MYXO-CTERM domain-containing protein
MSLALAAALAFTPAATLPTCSWDKPGHDPFMGNVVEAVERYTNIPLEVRDRLKQRMAARQYDEIVTIGRDAITGQQRYAADIRDMHFGNGRVCRTVSRSAWAPSAVERGLVYCEAGHCILVPTVCRNVSRITRLPADKPTAAAAPTLPGAPGLPGGTMVDTALPDGKPTLLAANGMSDVGELVFEPPGAGTTAGDSGRAAIQSALAGVASGGTAGALGDGGLAGGGGGGGPAIAFNPFPISGGGSGGTGDSGVPAPPFFPPVTGSYSPPTNPGDRLPGTVINPPTGVVVPPVIVVPEDPAPAVPEPGTWAMWAAGLAALAMLVRRRSAGGRTRVRS